RGNTSGVDGNVPDADLPRVAPGATPSDPPVAINPDPAGDDQAFVDTVYKYDILNDQIEMVQEVSNGVNPEFLHTLYRYDPNQNQVLVIQPEGNATASIYDERDLLFQTIRGATSPPVLAQLSLDDPRNYDVRGGLPSTTTYNYEANRNLIE